MSGPTHVANIGDRGARRRRASGVVWMAVAIGYLAVLFVVGEPRWMRLVVAIPAGLSAVGFLQARERT